MLLVGYGCLDVAAVRGQEVVDTRREYNVKAATLYAFGRYVTWPDSAFQGAADPFVIGVLGSNPFGDALDTIAAKKTIDGRPILVRQLASQSEYADCHIVFVTHAVPPEMEASLFRLVAGQPLLLVGEMKGFAERGGIVNFYLSGGHVRFELNANKAVEANLGLNAKLLSLGTKVSADE